MSDFTRFECASSSLPLRRLLRKTSSLLWGCLAVVMGAHLALMQLPSLQAAQVARRPLTTQFVKRQPRLTKPLELKKRPQPKRRVAQRQMVTVQARLARGRTSHGVSPAAALQGLARPRPSVGRAVRLAQPAMEPRSVAALVESPREPAHKLDMSLEMVDIEALDTGQYDAIVIQDPTDKRSIRGFFHLAVVSSPRLRHLTNQSMGVGVVLATLAEAVNRYTNIRTRLAGTYNLDSRELLRIPFIMITASGGKSFELSRSEVESLGRYLGAGGFSFVDDDDSKGGPVGLSLYRLVRQALESTGRKWGTDWTFDQIPDHHPLYHCFFDFDGCPSTLAWRPTYRFHRELIPHMDYLEGVSLDGRLVCVVSMEDFTSTWTMDVQNKVRQIQFGVNLIVFALTQEGSITHRLMDSIQ